VCGLKIQLLYANKEIRPAVSVFFLLLISLLTVLEISGQPVFTANKIRFKGLKRTKTSIVFREIAFKEGQRILLSDTSVLFRKSAANVFNTHLFNFCRYEIDSVRFDSAGQCMADVVFYVSERWYTFPSPIFELADRNFNEWLYDRKADIGRVNVGIRFIQKNVRGRNEDLILSIQGGFTRRLDFGYVIPYLDRKQIFGLKLNASFANNKDVAVRSVGNRLVYRRDETSFGRARMTAGFQISARPNVYDYHFLDINYYYNQISDSTFLANPSYFLGRDFQRFGEIRFSYVSDHRNFRNFGTKGTWLSLFIARNGILPGDNFRIWTVRGILAKYSTLTNWLYLASKIDVELSTNQKQPYLGTRVLGFDNRYVRGYERYVMEGNFNVHTRNTIRFKMVSTHYHANWFPVRQFRFIPVDVYLSPFADAGYVRNAFVLEENKHLINTPLLGYGIGLNFVTFYDVVFRAEYSMTRHGDKGFYISFLNDI
jgi:outer membrane protein assembly factor BamA